MSSPLTMYGAGLFLRAVLTPDVYVAPTGLQVALTRTVPPRNASADQLVEPTAAEYERQPYFLDGVHWAPTNFGELYNTTKITFAKVGTSGWGMISGWALLDPGSGQCLTVGSIMNPYQATAGMVPYLDPGSVVLGLYDNGGN
jgi:hypothetical protein